MPEVLDAPIAYVDNPKESEPTNYPPQIDDEFNLENPYILTPQKQVVVKDRYGWNETDITADLARELEYLSVTRGIEVEGERVKILQDMVDKMIEPLPKSADKLFEGQEPLDVRPRVVIMTKGSSNSEAFVMPDGTIFIAQALLNNLSSMDEIGAVLGHELGHLLNRTTEKRGGTNTVRGFGVSWLHEMASDLGTPQLLVNAGLNSKAFSWAITKIAPNDRGTAHQTGLSREVQLSALHAAIDYPTSNNDPTLIDPILKQEARATNFEIAIDAIKSLDLEIFKEVFGKLHRTDLLNVYTLLGKDWNVERSDLFKSANGILVDRLVKEGYSNIQAMFFLITEMEDQGPTQRNSYLIDSPYALINAVNELEAFDKIFKFTEMHEFIFNQNVDTKTIGKFLNLLKGNLYDMTLSSEENLIPVTDEILLDVLEKLSNSYENSQEYDRIPEALTEILLRYVDQKFIASTGREKVDMEAVKNFLTKAKERGIRVNTGKLLMDNYYLFHSSQFNNKVVYLHSEDKNAVGEAFLDIFGRPPKPEKQKFGLEFVDQFFEQFNDPNLPENAKISEYERFIKTLRKYFDNEKISDEERFKYVEYFGQKVESLNLTCKMFILDSLKKDFDPFSDTGIPYPENLTEEQLDQNKRFRVFNLKVLTAVCLMANDTDEFYSFVEQTMSDLQIDPNDLSLTQLSNLLQVLNRVNQSSNNLVVFGDRMHHKMFYAERVVKKGNYERFFKLPLVENLLQRNEQLHFGTIGELRTFCHDFLSKTFEESGNQRFQDVFGDSVPSLILGRAIRENAVRLIEEGVGESEYGDLYDFLTWYYPDGAYKRQILRSLNKIYLESEEPTFDNKMDYLVRNFNQVGLEGMQILGRQITTLDQYNLFRSKMGDKLTKYLSGEEIISSIALGDYLSSKITQNFETLFQTCETDLNLKWATSTQLAKTWTDIFVRYFNKDQQRFIVSNRERQAFQSFADNVNFLKDLSPIQRLVIAVKALTDAGGAFSSEENRKKLGEILVRSLGLKPGFVSGVIHSALSWDDAERSNFQGILTYPAANILKDLMFRSFSLDTVNFNEIGKLTTHTGESNGRYIYEELSDLMGNDLEHFYRSGTRDITLFGADYLHALGSPLWNLAQQSDRDFFTITRILQKQVNRDENGKKLDQSPDIDPAIEAVIKGIEASGSVGVRALQLAVQLYKFPPAIEKRLSSTLDANPGLDKIFFWENLRNRCQEDSQVNEFVGKLAIGDYLGGGSLYTTYAATMEAENGPKEIVMKMLNPNATSSIGESYKLASETLDRMITQTNSPEIRRQAEIAQVIIDLAQNWCLRDINDQTFEADDDIFKESIARLNQDIGEEIFYVPSREINTYKLKAEDRASGRTVNQILNDDSIDANTKRRIVNLLGKLFVHQLNKPAFAEEGQDRYLIHSDPHIGNYVVDLSDGKIRIGIIDRNMYLKLGKEDASIFNQLSRGDNARFLWSFVNRVVDYNKTRNDPERNRIRNRLLFQTVRDFGGQLRTGRVDNFQVMRNLLTRLNDMGLDIPFEMRLMTRNVAALRGLMSRYGSSF